LAPRVSLADAVPATAITPGLIAAAEKEGKVVWYTSVDLPVAEKVARSLAGRLEQYLPTEAAQFLPKNQIDPDSTFMSWRASLSPPS